MCVKLGHYMKPDMQLICHWRCLLHLGTTSCALLIQ